MSRGLAATKRPRLPGGGWAFQFANAHYPDLDDTAVVAWAMHQAPERPAIRRASSRALDWLVGMQSRNGGFAAFDVDNTHHYFNKIPSPIMARCSTRPPSDVTARVVTVLARSGGRRIAPRCSADRAPAPRAGSGRVLVRPLGHQLRLRHLVGTDRLARPARCRR